VPLATLLSIADLASHGALVRGGDALAQPLAAWRPLARVRVLINGVEVAVGSGGDVLGDPLLALTWLANVLRADGVALAPGDVVSSGTMTGLAAVTAGDSVTAEFDGVGDVRCAFVE
jgi:2-keto-4-pentenoate hydratase